MVVSVLSPLNLLTFSVAILLLLSLGTSSKTSLDYVMVVMELRPWIIIGNGHCNFSCPFEFGFFFSFSRGPLTLIVHKIQVLFVTKLWITKVIFNSLFCMVAFRSKVYQALYLLVRFTSSLSDCEYGHHGPDANHCI